MRYRETDERVPSTMTSYETRTTLPPLGTTVNMTGGYTGLRRHITDVKTPNYSRRRASGELILNDLAIRSSYRSYQNMYLEYSVPRDGNYHVTFTGDLAAFVEQSIPFSIPGQSDLGRMKDIALINAYAKISDGGILSGELVADLAHTISAMRHPMRSFTEAIGMATKVFKKKFRKGARHVPSSLVKAKADAWLEARYMWQPSILDAKQAIANASSINKRMMGGRKVVRAGQKNQWQKITSFSSVPLGWYSLWRVSGSVESRYKASVNAGVIIEIKPTSQFDQNVLDFKVGSSSLASTAWELIPFSFVADWFVNVGSFVAAHNLPPNVSVKGNWVTVTDEATIDYKSTDLENRGYRDSAYEHGQWGSSSILQQSVTRTCNLPLPTHPVAVSGWSTVTHATDAVALVVRPLLKAIQDFKHL